jgi:hypothetical protein
MVGDELSESDPTSFSFDDLMDPNTGAQSDTSFIADDGEDDMNWAPTNDAESPLILADNSVKCQADGDINDIKLFTKKARRQMSCQPSPKGQTAENEEPNSRPPEERDPFDFRAFINSLPAPDRFPEDLSFCPKNLFGNSNTPTCHNEFTGGLVQKHPPAPHATLWDSKPCMYIICVVSPSPIHSFCGRLLGGGRNNRLILTNHQ